MTDKCCRSKCTRLYRNQSVTFSRKTSRGRILFSPANYHSRMVSFATACSSGWDNLNHGIFRVLRWHAMDPVECLHRLSHHRSRRRLRVVRCRVLFHYHYLQLYLRSHPNEPVSRSKKLIIYEIIPRSYACYFFVNSGFTLANLCSLLVSIEGWGNQGHCNTPRTFCRVLLVVAIHLVLLSRFRFSSEDDKTKLQRHACSQQPDGPVYICIQYQFVRMLSKQITVLNYWNRDRAAARDNKHERLNVDCDLIACFTISNG